MSLLCSAVRPPGRRPRLRLAADARAGPGDLTSLQVGRYPHTRQRRTFRLRPRAWQRVRMRCKGQICFCDRCLYVFAVALFVFATATPTAIISQGHLDETITTGIAAVAGVSLTLMVFSLAVNFLAAWRKRHYYNLKHADGTGSPRESPVKPGRSSGRIRSTAPAGLGR